MMNDVLQPGGKKKLKSQVDIFLLKDNLQKTKIATN